MEEFGSLKETGVLPSVVSEVHDGNFIHFQFCHHIHHSL